MNILFGCALAGALIFASSCDRDTPRNPAGNGPKPGGNTVGVAELKPSECEELGGTIKYESQCDDYKLACRVETTSGTRQTCIDELDTAPE